MQGYLDKGHAQRIATNGSLSSNAMPGTSIWYLPRNPVMHPQKPENVRVVFDCAAKFQNTSLNDQLLQGPDFTNSLVGLLLRFQQEKVVVMADVEKMFHQVCVKPEDCDALRLLWWPKGDLDRDPFHYQMVVHLFGATSLPRCSSYALWETTKVNSVSSLSRRFTTTSM